LKAFQFGILPNDSPIEASHCLTTNSKSTTIGHYFLLDICRRLEQQK
jgi:hypothetical protein